MADAVKITIEAFHDDMQQAIKSTRILTGDVLERMSDQAQSTDEEDSQEAMIEFLEIFVGMVQELEQEALKAGAKGKDH